MSQTESQLLAVYGPAIPLDKVCEIYFGLQIEQARVRAARNELPIPTFRLRDSAKAPLLVRASDLAEHIDSTHEAALREWEKSRE